MAGDEETDEPLDEVIEYEFDRKSADDLAEALAKWVAQVSEGGSARTELIEAGLNPDELDLGTVQDSISFEEQGAGIAPVLIVVALDPAINHMAITLWDTAILPWIRDHVASDALGPEKKRAKRKGVRGKRNKP